MRIGIGYDVHKLVKGRRLILGGMEVPHEQEMGLLGHSDADVLVHAVIDALIGACGLGDIGRLFPDTDDKYKDISSMILLEKVYEQITHSGYKIVNIDSVIIAQKPKLAPFINEMENNICGVLHINPDDRCVNIKAKTEEGLGFTGSELGIAAKAVCLLERL